MQQDLSDTGSAKLAYQLVELLASKLCHDLVGPIAAINNGVELIAELGPDEEALGLVGESGARVADVLQFFRLAYGSGGRTLTDPAEFQRIANAHAGRERAELRWEGITTMLEDAEAKVVANLLAVAIEALPRGGEVLLQRRDPFAWTLTSNGRSASLREETLIGLAGNIPEDGISPRNAHALYCARLVLEQGLAIRVEKGEDQLTLST